jgi:hypothetical protein
LLLIKNYGQNVVEVTIRHRNSTGADCEGHPSLSDHKTIKYNNSFLDGYRPFDGCSTGLVRVIGIEAAFEIDADGLVEGLVTGEGHHLRRYRGVHRCCSVGAEQILVIDAGHQDREVPGIILYFLVFAQNHFCKPKKAVNTNIYGF